MSGPTDRGADVEGRPGSRSTPSPASPTTTAFLATSPPSTALACSSRPSPSTLRSGAWWPSATVASLARTSSTSAARSVASGPSPSTRTHRQRASGGASWRPCSTGRGRSGVRLLQDSFNTASLALYASLGFEVAEQVVLVAGVPPRLRRRRLGAALGADLEACEELCIAVHGFDRSAELRDALAGPDLTPVMRTATVACRLRHHVRRLRRRARGRRVRGRPVRAHRRRCAARRSTGLVPAAAAPARARAPVPGGGAAGREADDLHGRRPLPPPRRRLDPVRPLLTRSTHVPEGNTP